MTRLRVAIAGTTTDLDATHVPAVASLPTRYELGGRMGDVAGADVILAAGPDVDLAAVLGARPRAVVAHRIGRDRLDELAALARAAGVVIATPSPLVDDPAWAMARSWVAALGALQLVRMTIVIGGRDGTAAEHTATPGVRQLLDEALDDAVAVIDDVAPDLNVVHARSFDGGLGIVLDGAAPASLTVATVNAGPSRRRFEALATTGHVVVDFASPLLFGAPTDVRRHDAQGTTTAPPIDENGWRAGWRSLHDVITSDKTTTAELDVPGGALARRIERCVQA